MPLITSIVMILAAAPALPPTSAPATRDVVRTAEMEPLIDGSIRYAPPPGWQFIEKSDDNRKASYQTADGKVRMDINVSPQPRDVPDTYAKQMALIIGKTIREDADRSGQTILLAPRVEKDPRFFLKIHDRLSGEHGVIDRLQLYRVIGLNIVHVAVSVLNDSPDEVKPLHAAGEELLDGMRLTRGQTPVVFPRNKLKLKPPIDWKEAKTDAANGLVVTYTDPKQPTRQLIVRARVIPKDARDDPARRDAFIDKMIDDERRTAPLDGAKPIGDDQPVAGGAPREYLRHVRSDVQPEGGLKLRVQTRYFMVNDVVVSLRSVGTTDDETVLKIADALAVNVKPSRE
ncbi:MAG: hypothetical protein QOF78_2392 [Phycisphaerales bacterium]|nr:hypothetical protein [Phycisphaerales bacterium]